MPEMMILILLHLPRHAMSGGYRVNSIVKRMAEYYSVMLLVNQSGPV